VNQGINVVVAAGNENQDACYTSPGSSVNVITVAATNENDEILELSNHGNCVNVFAPGEKIESAWIGETNNLINVLSGTSMAAPHVSGVVALLLDTEKYANYSPEQMRHLIDKLSTKNLVKNIPIWSSTPNHLIYSSPPVKGTKYSDNDKTNDNDPDDLDDIDEGDDDDDKPDDLDDIDEGDGDDNNNNDDNNNEDNDDDLEIPDDQDYDNILISEKNNIDNEEKDEEINEEENDYDDENNEEENDEDEIEDSISEESTTDDNYYDSNYDEESNIDKLVSSNFITRRSNRRLSSAKRSREDESYESNKKRR